MKPMIHRCREPKPAGSPPVFKQELYGRDHHDFNLVRVEPGMGRAPHPYHEGDSFMLLLFGDLLLHVDGELYTLAPGDVAFIPKGAVRGFTAGGDGASFFAAHLREATA